jgi:hypothetical protein
LLLTAPNRNNLKDLNSVHQRLDQVCHRLEEK